MSSPLNSSVQNPVALNPATLDAETRQQARALLEFCREMGLADFYRGKQDPPLLLEDAAPMPEAATATQAAQPQTIVPAPAPLAPAMATASFAQEPDSPMPRKSTMPYPPNVALSDSPALALAKRPAALAAIREEIGDCQRCALCQARNKIVFGDGDPGAELMFVGEGPGADEDEQGLPFVGRAGQLLNNMIGAMGLRREQVYIANIVKCRPPQNRVPEPEEAAACTPFLFQQIDVIRPRMLVALGATAATYLLAGKSSLASLRGRIHDCRGAKLIVTYHPAYLLRDPRQKAEAWKDLQLAMKFLGLKAPTKPKG
jgi:uracil-DNA glycosylase family 4